MRRASYLALVVVAIAGVLAIGACGDPGEDTAPRPGGHRLSREEVQQQLRDAAGQARDRFGQLDPQAAAVTADELIASSGQGAPETLEQFLTAVIQDVNQYWTETLTAAGLPEPHVRYSWIPPGSTVRTACTDATGQPMPMSDTAAAYCPADDTIYISQKFASDIYNGALDDVLSGSSQGYGRTVGDFAVAFIAAHEYAHNVQHELGLYHNYAAQLPVKAFELQADCMAGTWANSVYRQGRLEEGDVEEALNAALAVGDFEPWNEGHHGTPQERYDAWALGYETGQPGACNRYLEPDDVNLGTTPQTIVVEPG
jgi:predicted metalloprotease